MACVVGQVADLHTRSHDGGLVADRVDPAQQLRPRPGVPHVELVGAVGGDGCAVGLGKHQVEPDHLVPVRLEDLADRGTDEAGRAGQQHPHGIS